MINATQQLLDSRSQIWDKLSYLLLIHVFLAATLFYTRFNLHSLDWLVIYLLATACFVVDRDSLLNVITKNWLLFLFPVFALCSTYWSEAPVKTLTTSIQLTFTVTLGLWITSRFSASTILKALLVAGIIGLSASLINSWLQFLPAPAPELPGHPVPESYSGIYPQKNALGRALGLASLALVFLSAYRYRSLLTVPLLIAFGAGIVVSASATSLILYVGVMALGLVSWLSRASKDLLPISVFILGLIVLVAAYFLVLSGVSPTGQVLEFLGKDATLTGRTYIWSVGFEQVARHPWLGLGYEAFWEPGLFPEVGRIQSTFDGMNINGFHSAPVEVLVGTGGIGLFIYTIVILEAFRRVLQQLLIGTKTNITHCAASFMILTVVVSAVEVIMTRPHEIFFLLFCIFFALLGNKNLSESPQH